jgi:hypothetical protein
MPRVHRPAGAFIALEFTLNIFGVVVAYWLEFGLGFVGDGRSQVRWRFPIAFQILPVMFFMVKLSRSTHAPLFTKFTARSLCLGCQSHPVG